MGNINKIPLAEDIVLKGINTFQNAQSEYDWDFLLKKDVTGKEESIIRIIKILSFGKVLSKIEDTRISFDENKNVLVCKLDEKAGDDGVSAAAIMEELVRLLFPILIETIFFFK